MPWNDKSLRLRAARDRLHQKGQYEPTFKQKVDLIIEILGTIHSPRNLSWCRRYTAKLRERYPEMTPEQLQLIGVLDDRLFKKAELIKNRQERKKAAKSGNKRGQPIPTPQPVPTPPGAIDPFSI